MIRKQRSLSWLSLALSLSLIGLPSVAEAGRPGILGRILGRSSNRYCPPARTQCPPVAKCAPCPALAPSSTTVDQICRKELVFKALDENGDCIAASYDAVVCPGDTSETYFSESCILSVCEDCTCTPTGFPAGCCENQVMLLREFPGHKNHKYAKELRVTTTKPCVVNPYDLKFTINGVPRLAHAAYWERQMPAGRAAGFGAETDATGRAIMGALLPPIEQPTSKFLANVGANVPVSTPGGIVTMRRVFTITLRDARP